MECPNCNNTLKIPFHAERNMECSGSSAVVKTDCCSTLVHCSPANSYRVQPYRGQRTEDDWGDAGKTD